MSIEMLRDLGKDAPRIFVYSTGAGAGIQKKIWEVPGCSNFLVGCAFPYATNMTTSYLGMTPERFVSTDTAIELAMAAYCNAVEPGRKAIGIGMTASVASAEIHRGAHRIVVSSVSEDECLVFETEIPKKAGLYERRDDGILADRLGIAAMLRASNVCPGMFRKPPVFISNEFEKVILAEKDVGLWCMEDDVGKSFNKHIKDTVIEFIPVDASEQAKKLLAKKNYFTANGIRSSEYKIDNSKVIFYPGSFNPLHFGHEAGAEAIRQAAAKEFGECRDVVFTTVVNPPHKAALTHAQMLNRVATMKGRNFCLTFDDPLFINKAERHPNGWFGLGADALITMLDPKWGYDVPEMLERISVLKNKMFIMGRLVNNEFVTLANIKERFPIVEAYKHLFIEVPGRWDISSTELRQKLG